MIEAAPLPIILIGFCAVTVAVAALLHRWGVPTPEAIQAAVSLAALVLILARLLA